MNVDILARFADEKGKITKSIVKPKLFEPTIKGNLSVFNVSDLSNAEKCKCGYNNVAKQKGRKLYGWAELEWTEFEKIGLEVFQDNDPQGHANVTGWSTERKARKDQAQLLAKAATLPC